MYPKHRKKGSWMLLMLAGLLLYPVTEIQAAVLKPETIEAWNDYVEATEARIEHELNSNNGFLIGDFDKNINVSHERNDLLTGNIPIDSMESKDENTRRINVPKGRIHHWRGGIFIPGVTLDYVLSRVENPIPTDMQQEDVLESQVLGRSPGYLKLFLKLQRSKIVTVVYNTEHMVHFQRHGPRRASSSSVATKIAEVERLDGGLEREKPIGNDHGFLWRINSYWRYEETDGGVIVECESITLSRSIPSILDLLVSPIINKVARESMERTLVSMRTRMTKETQNMQESADNASKADTRKKEQAVTRLYPVPHELLWARSGKMQPGYQSLPPSAAWL